LYLLIPFMLHLSKKPGVYEYRSKTPEEFAAGARKTFSLVSAGTQKGMLIGTN